MILIWKTLNFDPNYFKDLAMTNLEFSVQIAPGFCDNHWKFNYSSVEPIKDQMDQFWPDYEIRLVS